MMDHAGELSIDIAEAKSRCMRINDRSAYQARQSGRPASGQTPRGAGLRQPCFQELEAQLIITYYTRSAVLLPSTYGLGLGLEVKWSF